MLRRVMMGVAVVALSVLSGVSSAEGPAREFKITDGRLELPATFAFETGTATLSPDSDAVLDFVAAFLAEKDYISLARIEGHVGEGADAQRLSERRALAVVSALVKRGVECKRLLPVGFGANKPVAANDTAEGRARNTRVEVAMAQLRGRAIGGMPVDGGGLVAGDPCK